MEAEQRKVLTFKVEKYKSTGKYYTEESPEFECKIIPGSKPEIFTTYMSEACDYARQRYQPWLEQGGIVRITQENGYPCLLLPSED